MTEASIEAMIDEAQRRFDIFGARVVHRIGLLAPAQPDRAGGGDLGPRARASGL